MNRCAMRLAGVAFVVVLVAAQAFAQTFTPPTPSGFVNDFAGVVDAESAARMERMARNFRDRAGTDVAVVTLDTLDGYPLERAGYDIGKAWGIGGPQDKQGIILIVVVNDRRSRLEVSRHLEGDMPDILAAQILRASGPYFARQQYGQGLSLALESILATIANAQGISIEGIDASRGYANERTGRSRDGGGGISVGTIVFLIFVLFVIFGSFRGGGGGGGGGRRRRRYGGGGFIPIFIPGGWGGGGGSSGGSSWGGGGGGDSWGGFGGGGDFGGGGASDSW